MDIAESDTANVRDSTITAVSEQLGLKKDTLNSSRRIFERLDEKNHLLHLETPEKIGASIYLGAKENEEPIQPYEVCSSLSLSQTELLKSVRRIKCNLEYTVQPIHPQAYISRFSDDLSIQQESEELAIEILTAYEEESGLSGSPVSLAASALYATSVIHNTTKLTQSQLSSVANVSEVTIRKRYQEMITAYKGKDNE